MQSILVVVVFEAILRMADFFTNTIFTLDKTCLPCQMFKVSHSKQFKAVHVLEILCSFLPILQFSIFAEESNSCSRNVQIYIFLYSVNF